MSFQLPPSQNTQPVFAICVLHITLPQTLPACISPIVFVSTHTGPQRNVPQKNPVMGKKPFQPCCVLLHPLFRFYLFCNDSFSSSSSSLPCSLHLRDQSEQLLALRQQPSASPSHTHASFLPWNFNRGDEQVEIVPEKMKG